MTLFDQPKAFKVEKMQIVKKLKLKKQIEDFVFRSKFSGWF